MNKIGLLLAVYVILLMISSVSRISYGREKQKLYSQCFTAAGKKYGLNPRILQAVAFTESGFHPYAVNVRGKSYIFEKMSEAYNFLRENLRKNPDIGLMQVNYYWFRKLHIPFWYGFEPCYNIFLGAYILREKINRYGNGWFGIAAYHSTTPEKNIRYAWRIYGSLRRVDSEW